MEIIVSIAFTLFMTYVIVKGASITYGAHITKDFMTWAVAFLLSASFTMGVLTLTAKMMQ